MSEQNAITLGTPIACPPKWEPVEEEGRDIAAPYVAWSPEVVLVTAETHSSCFLWKPLYITALVAMVINVVLIGVSVAIDIIRSGVLYATKFPFSHFADVCAGGCDAFSMIVTDKVTSADTQKGNRNGRHERLDRMVASVAPLTVYGCTWFPAIDAYKFTVISEANSHLQGEVVLSCDEKDAKAIYSFSYRAGGTSYHLPGGPRIRGVDTLLNGWIQVVEAFFFFLGCVALIVHIAAVVSRARLRRGATNAQETYPCGTGCNAGPEHTLNLLIAVVALVGGNIIVTIAQFGACGAGMPSSQIQDLGTQQFTATHEYYAILAIMLVMELLAAGCVVTAIAMRA